MRIRIVTFGLTIPAEAYTAHAEQIAAGFTAWPGLIGKWWLADPASGAYGGVYLFASQSDADSSRICTSFENSSKPALFVPRNPRRTYGMRARVKPATSMRASL